MTMEFVLFLTLVIFGFGSFTAALTWAEYCSIHVDNRLGCRHWPAAGSAVRKISESMNPRSIPIASSSKLLEVEPTKVAA